MLNLKHEDQRGYTLVELVVVIAILGILAIIAVPMANNFLEGSEGPAYNADVATVPGPAPIPSQRRGYHRRTRPLTRHRVERKR